MRIQRFQIENYRNLKFVKCDNVPNFMVICGGNGCGKSALLDALITAKEVAGSYAGSLPIDNLAISVGSEQSRISMTVALSEGEREFYTKLFARGDVPETQDVVVRLNRLRAEVEQMSLFANDIFRYFSTASGSPGFFDYISPDRQIDKLNLKTWDATLLSDEHVRSTLIQRRHTFQNTKQYLAGLKMQDLQTLQIALREGREATGDSLNEIRQIFNRILAPTRFDDVYIEPAQFRFIVSTSSGEIDIDDLSSGEKEILNTFVHFHQLKLNGAIIMFDEADAHLHPDLERRYLQELRQLSSSNQLILTTHSPEMMMEAGTDSLFTIIKHPESETTNQLVRVTDDESRYSALAELMGSRGIVSFNQKIVFIEGTEASADRAIYETFYPSAQYNISFVPAGDSGTVRKTAERVNELLTAGTGFQQYFSIVDGDIERSIDDPTKGDRLFRLPVYHVENLLLDESEILKATRASLGVNCPYTQEKQVVADLLVLLLSDSHLNPYTRAILDAKVAKIAQQAHDAVFKNESFSIEPKDRPSFDDAKKEAQIRLQKSISDGTWRNECKGRDLLKAYCAQHNLRYEHFRNNLLSGFSNVPLALDGIMQKIVAA